MVSLKKASGEHKQVYISLLCRGTPGAVGKCQGENGEVTHVLSLPPPLLSLCIASLHGQREMWRGRMGIFPRCFLPSPSPSFALSVYMVKGKCGRGDGGIPSMLSSPPFPVSAQ